MAEPDLRDRYPEIERPLRYDGRSESVKITMAPVMEKLHRILNVIEDIAHWKELEYEKSFVFQSRAMGTSKPTSDIDIYVKLNDKHTELVMQNGVSYKNTGVTLLAGEWATKFFGEIPQHLNEELLDLHIDIFWGVNDLPPAKDEYKGRNYYFQLEKLRNES